VIRRLQRRVRYWLHSGERARLLREEMEFHLAMKAEEFVEGGMTESDARGAARRQFGNPTLQQEEARGTWIARWLADLVPDWVFAVRTIRHQPGFAAVAVLSAALGIGGCSLIFGIANFALFRSLPVEDPARLVSVSGSNLRRGRVGSSLAYPDFEDIRHARSFQGMTAFFQFMPATISGNGEPQRYWGSLVTANYFDVVRPGFVVGRGFDAAKDDQKGEAPVVVLSHDLWRSRFGGDATIVGRSIEWNRRKVTVVGVTGPGFRGTEAMFFSDYWVPFSMLSSLTEVGMGGERLQDRSGQWLMAAGRLREGVTEREAAAEIEVIGKQLSNAYPATNTDRGFHVERAGQVNAGFRKMIVVFFLMLLGVAALVLCTACANVANLLLARASARQKEIATRLAIGAGRGRLVRQLLTESVILALLGGIAGYAIAHLGAVAIGRSRIPLALPVDFSLTLDYRVMLFSIALATFTGVAFGLVPALRATRQDLTGALKDERVSIGQSRRLGLRNLLVVAQVAICMVLLICSSLFVRSLYSAGNIDLGFAHRNMLMMAFDPSLNRYAPDETRRVADAILENARAIPGVESASLGNSVPLNLEGTQNSFVPGSADKQATPVRADIYSVAPQFFDTFGIRVIDGEDFRAGVPADDIVIVNQAAAEKAFPQQNPVGRRIAYLGRSVRIVGLVATTKSRTIGEEPHPCLYFPIARDVRGNDSLTGITLILRTRGNPAGYTAAVLQRIRKIDPTLAVFDIRTMETQISQALFVPRAAALLFGLAGFMGLLISAVGIYGVISFSVARQTKEIGVRMAMGARRVQVVGMVLKRGLVLTAAGSAIGLALALALSRTAASLLYGVSPTDTLTFILVPVFLLLIALAACLVPARRAASLDPMHALKYE
jgi:putative ABC transport system permease protein